MQNKELTSKQRAYLRSLASNYDTIFQIGKGEITENYVKQIDSALEARELIKISVLENSEMTARELANELCEKANCQSVQIIGRKIVLYREAKDKDRRNI